MIKHVTIEAWVAEAPALGDGVSHVDLRDVDDYMTRSDRAARRVRPRELGAAAAAVS